MDGMVDVGGRSLHLHCVGEGAPLVVLDAGFGNDGSVWSKVQPAVGRVTRVCAYDRAGMGYSTGPAPRPHTNRQMARELHELLQRAGLDGPYVLVGHSMGGINVRLFASEHPDAVAGMVLIDATQDPMLTQSLLSDEEIAEWRAAILASPEGLDADTFVAGAADMRAASRSIGNKPLVVLTRGKEEAPRGASSDRAAAMLRIWQQAQSDLPHLSTNAAHIVARNSRHFIQWDAPHLVVASIREVVEATRTHRQVNDTVLSPLATESPSSP